MAEYWRFLMHLCFALLERNMTKSSPAWAEMQASDGHASNSMEPGKSSIGKVGAVAEHRSSSPGVFLQGVCPADSDMQPNAQKQDYLTRTKAYIMVATHGSLPTPFTGPLDEEQKQKKHTYLLQAIQGDLPEDTDSAFKEKAKQMQALYKEGADKALDWVQSKTEAEEGRKTAIGVGYDGDGFFKTVPQPPTALALHVMMRLSKAGYDPYLLEAQVCGYSTAAADYPSMMEAFKSDTGKLLINEDKVDIDVFKEGGANVLHYPYVKACDNGVPTKLSDSASGLANPQHGAWDNAYGGMAGDQLAGSTESHSEFLNKYGGIDKFPSSLLVAWDDRLADPDKKYEQLPGCSICKKTEDACTGRVFENKGAAIEVLKYFVAAS